MDMNRERLYRNFYDDAERDLEQRHDENGTQGKDLVFQVLSWYATDVDDDTLRSSSCSTAATGGEDEDEDEENEKEGDGLLLKSAYVIKMFGVTRQGRSVSVTVHGFCPYFYVRVPEEMQDQPRYAQKILPQTIRDIAANEFKCCRKRRDSVLDVSSVRRKNFWGFKDGKRETFLRIAFKRQSAMRGMANFLSRNALRVRERGLVNFELYESNIDPLLRFIHERDIEAAGWIRIPHRVVRDSDRCDVLPVTEHVAHDVNVRWTDVHPVKGREDIAPLLVAAFDIESNSSHGDFSVAVKTYKRTAADIVRFYDEYIIPKGMTEYGAKKALRHAVKKATWMSPDPDNVAENDNENHNQVRALEEIVTRVVFKDRNRDGSSKKQITEDQLSSVVDDAYSVLCGKHPHVKKAARISVISDMFSSTGFPQLEGDEIIQIGTTFHICGRPDCCYRHIITLGSCERVSNGDCDGALTDTVCCDSEIDLLLEWADMMRRLDPDLVTGFNIFGFDMAYMYARAQELGRAAERGFVRLGRLRDVPGEYKENNLSSSALGDNVLKFVDMQGRTLMDLMKIVQRDYKLDSYKLDNVAKHFTGNKKHDITAADIFRLQRGNAEDRRIIAEYCLQDCALCNRLVMKLEVIANNLGMANVCSVPLAYIFMRGQGVKVFSLVARQCRLDEFVIPTIKKDSFNEADATAEEIEEHKNKESYEGAIVLEPKAGMYLDDPVTVLDYASLYPSSMISENISHDCLVMDPKYAAVPGVTYEDITYDTPDGPCTCKFAQLQEKGVLPRILQQLLKARKTTRKRIPLEIVTFPDGTEKTGSWDVTEGVFTGSDGLTVSVEVDKRHLVSVRPLYNDFQRAVLDGLQNAYKVTANSLYGQMGASTSPLYLKHVAACTTATGRSLILRAKSFMESKMNVNVIYGDTDSLFMIFDVRDENGQKLRGKPALERSIERAREAAALFKPHLKPPHDLEYEKTFWPFVIFSKKRYVGNLYEDDVNKCKRKEMGIVLKRRDNAQIVKDIYGGIINIVLNNCDIPASVHFLRKNLEDLIMHRTPNEKLVITKTLAGHYKDPEHQAHYVLAQRIGEREPGNKPQTNDRIPYIYIETPASQTGEKKPALQGDRIEDPGYVERHNLRPDVEHYITNQIMKPVLQLYSIVLEQIDGYRPRAPGYWEALKLDLLEKYDGDEKKARKKYDDIREAEVKGLLFDPFLKKLAACKLDARSRITRYFTPAAKEDDVQNFRRSTKKKKCDDEGTVDVGAGRKDAIVASSSRIQTRSQTREAQGQKRAPRYKQAKISFGAGASGNAGNVTTPPPPPPSSKSSASAAAAGSPRFDLNNEKSETTGMAAGSGASRKKRATTMRDSTPAGVCGSSGSSASAKAAKSAMKKETEERALEKVRTAFRTQQETPPNK